MTTTTVMTITDEQIAEIRDYYRSTDAEYSVETLSPEGCLKVSLMAEEILDLRSRLRAAEKDAERYRWLRERYYAADFSYGAYDGFSAIEAMVFRMPEGHVFTSSCDKTIDTAMEQSK